MKTAELLQQTDQRSSEKHTTMETTATLIPCSISESIKNAFVEAMDKTYNLIYTDYNDNYDNNPKVIQSCMNSHSCEALDNSDWLSDSRCEGSNYELQELIRKILSDQKHEAIHSYIEDWIEDPNNHNELINLIEERDASTPVTDILARTKLNGRATLYTNYDCLLNNYDMNNTYCYGEYFKDIVDILCLNPAKVKQVFHEKGINTVGKWPNKPKRNGNEAIHYEDLADEMLNQNCYGLLTFMGMMPLTNLYENNFREYKTIIVPKGNLCGMFSHWNGGGSLLEMELLRDLHIPVTFPRKTEFDRCELLVDEPNCGNGYCINEVYGLVSSAWGEELKLIYK